jgi:hypothetical protein
MYNSESPLHTWFVVDGEMNGRIAGTNALLSVGVTACSEREILGDFEVNIKPFHGSVEDPEVMAWWATIPDTYQYVTRNALSPSVAMRRLADFVKSYPGEPVFVGCPMGFDFSWIDWYQKTFLPENVFNHYCFDLVTAVHTLYGFDWVSSRRKNWPPEWLGDSHNHTALQDSRGYAKVFLMVKERMRALEQFLVTVNSGQSLLPD